MPSPQDGSLILCIDDVPVRYERLCKMNQKQIFVVTCRQEEVRFYLSNYREQITGICLDHDMPFRDGEWFAELLTGYSIPVAITSQNPSGASKMQALLQEYEVPVTLLPVLDSELWALNVLHFFRHGR